MPARHTDRLRAKRSSTLDVGWCVSNHNQALADDVESQGFAGATPSGCRQLGTMLVIGPKRVNLEPIGIDTRGGQLDPGPGLDIAREQTKNHTLSLLQRIENLGHSLERSDVELPTPGAIPQAIEVE